MAMFAEKSIEIGKVIHNYLEGIYQGDVERLRSSFTDNAQLWGEVKGAEYFKSLENYLEGVKNRKSPRELDEAFKMKILSLEITGNIATAKLHVPMLGYNYYDFLSLGIVKGEWKIVNKLFTHVE